MTGGASPTSLVLLMPESMASARMRRSKAEALYFGMAEPMLQRQKFGEAIEVLKEGTERVKGSAQLELALGSGSPRVLAAASAARRSS